MKGLEKNNPNEITKKDDSIQVKNNLNSLQHRKYETASSLFLYMNFEHYDQLW